MKSESRVLGYSIFFPITCHRFPFPTYVWRYSQDLSRFPPSPRAIRRFRLSERYTTTAVYLPFGRQARPISKRTWRTSLTFGNLCDVRRQSGRGARRSATNADVRSSEEHGRLAGGSRVTARVPGRAIIARTRRRRRHASWRGRVLSKRFNTRVAMGDLKRKIIRNAIYPFRMYHYRYYYCYCYYYYYWFPRSENHKNQDAAVRQRLRRPRARVNNFRR